MIVRILKNIDFSILFAVLALSAFGTVMVYSASMVSSVMVYDVTPGYFFEKQLLSWGLGIGALFFGIIFPYRNYRRLFKLILLVTVILLGMVFIIGQTTNNAQSWISLPLIGRFQPAELAKMSLIIYLAAIYTKKSSYIQDFTRGLLPPMIITMLVVAMILKQPDLGTAVIALAVSGLIIMSSGLKKSHLFFMLGLVLVAAVTMYQFGLSEEQLSRFDGAYQPFEYADDAGYQLINSYLAIHNGGIIGTGLGAGVQKLGYLPEAHTDFIMAVIAEELGIIGVAVVIGLLALIVLRGFYVSMNSHDTFGRLLSIGVSGLIGIQAVINLGGLTGLIPLTGVPLPFVSFGGTSLLMMMFSAGILINIHAISKIKKNQEERAAA
ncbi:cell division protein FtsW [Halobacillus litoralis]|uniref:Probable peptidoglycan glycosyltransferase FtsW n=1 Tax=Halobacillus litoralis TaxID=45668 RepID=A0A845DRP9_9BACI|nr:MULTISPECIES: FtsW/RodA/SpoVE family cell cycle protein [Halobacillus]MCA1022791.1 FtsW/RodA/SpoVE family cell cycle protein [Halobacillus litoralis]MYL19539.1 cell division protein FtsW [Halobacillus litoralis]MYL28684.1 cell division protein FtsW [Halobacillus halophilus]MYL36932.1 cell division protein FtsW [Halobacillus litoralis]